MTIYQDSERSLKQYGKAISQINLSTKKNDDITTEWKRHSTNTQHSSPKSLHARQNSLKDDTKFDTIEARF